MIAHIYDIDTLLVVNSYVWIVPKTNPSFPILKLTMSEFNLIKSGIYKKHNSFLIINGTKYWLQEHLLEKIKLLCKNNSYNITELAFSMQEFLNPEITNDLDFTLLNHNFKHLKNKTDDIYIICSRMAKKNYEMIVDELESALSEIGIVIKSFYFISKTFYNRDDTSIAFNKSKLLAQHIIGLKSNQLIFTNEEIDEYDTIYFYDDDLASIKAAMDTDKLLKTMIDNSEEYIKNRINDSINNNYKKIIIREVTNNIKNPFKEKIIDIESDSIIKFERYRIKF